MINNKSLKLSLWTAMFAATIGLSACQKDAADAPEQETDAEVATMSADPAEGNQPAIVADDLDDLDSADAHEQSVETPEVGAESSTPSASAIDDSSEVDAIDNAPVTDSAIGPAEGTVQEEATTAQ